MAAVCYKGADEHIFKNALQQENGLIERVLKKTVVILIVSISLVQLFYRIPIMGNKGMNARIVEGRPIRPVEFFYSEGFVILKIESNPFVGKSIKILVNGDEVCDMRNLENKILLKNCDVLEIDGTLINEEVTIRITKKSDNMQNSCVNKLLKIQGNLIKVFTAMVENSDQN